jgi:hypothetical protein
VAQLQYTAEVKAGLLLELPEEAHKLHLQPGDKVRVQLYPEHQETAEIASNKAKRLSALGKYAFVAGGSEEFAKEKQIEIEREDRAR